jgi:hypothetical protein
MEPLRFGLRTRLQTSNMGDLRDKFLQYDAVSCVAVCRIFGLPIFRILSALRSPNACAPYHPSVHVMRGSSSRRVLTYWMTRRTLHFLTILLNAVEMLWSIVLALDS